MTERKPPGDKFVDEALQRKAEARNGFQSRRNGRSLPRRGTNGRSEGGYTGVAFDAELEAVRTASKGTRNDTLNRAAFNLGQLVAAGALNEDDVVRELTDAARDAGLTEREIPGTIKSGLSGSASKPRDMSNVGKRNDRHIDPAERTRKMVSLTDIQILEGDFWNERDSLWAIYQAALARMCSPWAVLGCCAAKTLALVRPHVQLPPIVAGPGSLNWFCVITAPSGGGKGGAMSVCDEMVREIVVTRAPGSGEGFIDAYIKTPAKQGNPVELHESVMFETAEIDQMQALMSRSGNTLSPIMRSAWSAETLGFSNRKASSLHLVKHTYRATAVLAVQPARASVLLDDPHGGMLQRFMWFPAIDERVSRLKPDMPKPLVVPDQSCWEWPKQLEVPQIAWEEIEINREKFNRSEVEGSKGHALYTRLKFAFALTCLDGRSVMNEDDWRLAEIATHISDHTRKWVESEMERAIRADAERRGVVRGVEYAAADEEKAGITNSKRKRVYDNVFEKIKDSKGGLTKGELNYLVAYRDRTVLLNVLDALVADKMIKRVEGKRAGKWVAYEDDHIQWKE